MFKLTNWVVATLAVLFVATSCDENNIGMSIIDSESEVISDTTYIVCSPEINDKVPPRTLTHLLGAISAKGYGTLKSDFVTEFMPASKIDTTGVSISDIDSTRLLLRIPVGSFVGDSITPMKVNIYKLNKNLPYPITSDFDPKDYYNESDLLGSRAYAMTTTNQDSVMYKEYDSNTSSYNYYYLVSVTMPNSIGQGLYQLYKDNPETLKDPEAFAKYFPGIYATTSYGNGRVAKVSSTMIRTHYRKHSTKSDGSDTIYTQTANYLGVAPEVVTNNNISYTPSENIKSMIDAGDPVIVAPAGYNAKITLPITELLNKYKENEKKGQTVLNTISMTIPVEEISNSFDIEPPTYLLLVKATKKDDFFTDNKLPDSKTSFYASYDSTDKCYTFSGMRAYLKGVIDGEYASEDQTTLESFYLIPVDATFTTSTSYYSGTTSTLTEMTPQLSIPAMVKLGKAQLVTTFSKKSYSE